MSTGSETSAMQVTVQEQRHHTKRLFCRVLLTPHTNDTAEEEEELHSLPPAKKSDHLCKSWQSCQILTNSDSRTRSERLLHVCLETCVMEQLLMQLLLKLCKRCMLCCFTQVCWGDCYDPWRPTLKPWKGYSCH